jgi:ATP-binding cassette subfamily C protein CydC
MSTGLQQILAAEGRRQRHRLLLAGIAAAAVSAAAVLLLGLSGWFVTAAALAGAAGPANAAAFNYLLPSAAIRLLAILRTGSRYAERLVGHDAALRALAGLRPALFRALATAPAEDALTLSAGDATARMIGDVDAVEARFIRQSASWSAVSALLTGTGLLLLAGTAPAIATALVAGTFLWSAHRLATALQPRGRDAQRAAGLLKQDFAILAAAAPELRAYGLEGWAADRVAERGQALTAAQERVAGGAGWFDLLQAAATGGAAFLAMALSTAAPLPLAALAALGAAMTVDGTAAMARGMERRGSLREAEARLDNVLTAAVPEVPGSATDVPPVIRLGKAAPLQPGMVAGLVGCSGCGKTTLLEQLLKLRPVEAGRIGLGGADAAQLPAAGLRRWFSLLPQDATLISGTVRDNLRLAAPDADDAAIWEALRDAALEERVRTLPQQLDSWLGENGARLSSGERRRLALARALLRPVPWLLLDEPTEGLDAQTEALVIEGLRRRLRRSGQGALIVTHRKAPLALCDRVLDLTPALVEGHHALAGHPAHHGGYVLVQVLDSASGIDPDTGQSEVEVHYAKS